MTDHELEELKAGLAGLPAGPWTMSPWHIEEGPSVVRVAEGWVLCPTSADSHAAHLARCSPDKIASLIARLEAAEGARSPSATFEVHQDGTPVALASGPRGRAYAEAMHYAAVYGQDGPVEVFEHVPVALPKAES
ncbi:MAG: hypothetical protein K2Z25_01925 [Beijerinckiaceae bacterium]|nr:hypothetical protein [Beijerinckiaceae bacterium]